MGTFECLVLLVLKKASSSSAARCWRTSTCSSQAWYQQCFYQVTTRQTEMMTCFPKTAYLGREPGGFHVSFSLKKLNLGIPQRSILLKSFKILEWLHIVYTLKFKFLTPACLCNFVHCVPFRNTGLLSVPLMC